MKHLFISYDSNHRPYAVRLANALRAKGYAIWIDVENIPGSSKWLEEIQQAIDNSYAVLILMTAEAEKSQWVQREQNYAELNDISIIPLLREGKIWFSVSNLQYVDARNNSLEDPVPPGLYVALSKYTQDTYTEGMVVDPEYVSIKVPQALGVPPRLMRRTRVYFWVGLAAGVLIANLLVAILASSLTANSVLGNLQGQFTQSARLQRTFAAFLEATSTPEAPESTFAFAPLVTSTTAPMSAITKLPATQPPPTRVPPTPEGLMTQVGGATSVPVELKITKSQFDKYTQELTVSLSVSSPERVKSYVVQLFNADTGRRMAAGSTFQTPPYDQIQIPLRDIPGARITLDITALDDDGGMIGQSSMIFTYSPQVSSPTPKSIMSATPGLPVPSGDRWGQEYGRFLALFKLLIIAIVGFGLSLVVGLVVYAVNRVKGLRPNQAKGYLSFEDGARAVLQTVNLSAIPRLPRLFRPDRKLRSQFLGIRSITVQSSTPDSVTLSIRMQDKTRPLIRKLSVGAEFVVYTSFETGQSISVAYRNEIGESATNLTQT